MLFDTVFDDGPSLASCAENYTKWGVCFRIIVEKARKARSLLGGIPNGNVSSKIVSGNHTCAQGGGGVRTPLRDFGKVKISKKYLEKSKKTA